MLHSALLRENARTDQECMGYTASVCMACGVAFFMASCTMARFGERHLQDVMITFSLVSLAMCLGASIAEYILVWRYVTRWGASNLEFRKLRDAACARMTLNQESQSACAA